MTEFHRKCRYCGAEFTTQNRTKVYCDPKCRAMEQNEKYRERQKKGTVKICPECKKEFSTKVKEKTYCSRTCLDKAYRRRKEEAKELRDKLGLFKTDSPGVIEKAERIIKNCEGYDFFNFSPEMKLALIMDAALKDARKTEEETRKISSEYCAVLLSYVKMKNKR